MLSSRSRPGNELSGLKNGAGLIRLGPFQAMAVLIDQLHSRIHPDSSGAVH